MQWLLRQCDILDVSADVLVCSANVFLNLSGGAGGAFLLRYGPEMQQRMHAHLAEMKVKHLPRGTVVQMPPCGSSYRAVLHAIAVDGMYQSSPQVIEATLVRSLELASSLNGRTVAMAALATGYGRMTMSDFAAGVRPVLSRDFDSIETVAIAIDKRNHIDALANLIPELHRV